MTVQLACMTQMLIRSAGARHSGTAIELCQSSAARMAKATVPRSGGGGGEGRCRRGGNSKGGAAETGKRRA